MQIKEWLATKTFELLSALGIPTHQGEGSAHDSTLDLVWTNYVASLQHTFKAPTLAGLAC